MALEAATKALLYAALLPTIGASAAFLFVIARLKPRATNAEPRATNLEASLRHVGLIASACVVVALALRAWAQADAAFGLADSFSPGSLATVAIDSRWGRRWQLQVLAAFACVFAYAGARGGGRLAWIAASIAGVGLCVSLALTGHAAGDPMRMVVHAAHLMGAGIWLGTLATLSLAAASMDAGARGQIFRAFSPIALIGAGVTAAMGLTAAGIYVGSFGNLSATAYGRTLLVKLALVAGVASCGYTNWRRACRGAAPRAAIVELLFAAAVIVVTAVLTELDHP